MSTSSDYFLLTALTLLTIAIALSDARHFRESSKRQKRSLNGYIAGLPNFPCESVEASSSVPENVRQVRPADIQVVGALGDSLTAANGAKPKVTYALDIMDVFRNDRGVSWSIGGDESLETLLTLPNILKKYNSELKGFSTGSWYGTENEFEEGRANNFAEARATANELVHQSELLIGRLQRGRLADSWKIITIFIGGNDVCKYCRFRRLLSPENFRRNLEKTLDNLFENLPRTIVNLVDPLDLSQVTKLPDDPVTEAVARRVCSCAYRKNDPDFASRQSKVYQQEVQNLLNSTRWDREDFAVSHHVFTKNMEFPKNGGDYDRSYVTTDRIHFSLKGHETAAINLWNSMMTPAQNRTTTLQFDKNNVRCPTIEQPFIFI